DAAAARVGAGEAEAGARAAARVGRVGGDRRVRRGRVDQPGEAVGARVDIAGLVDRPHIEGVAAVGEAAVALRAGAGDVGAAVALRLEAGDAAAARVGAGEAEAGARA